jgi:hypothetical protein
MTVKRQTTRFDGVMKATASAANPMQSELSFVFTDYAPNKNKQGVSQAEAANLIRTGLYQPVKVDFQGNAVGDHYGAIPIGPIISLIDEGDRLVGKAVVWREEYADVVTYLEAQSSKASATDTSAGSTGGVQFSWELYYTESAMDEAGIEWLGNCTVAATTIVDVPAYQGRTPLLAMAAEQRTITELTQRIEVLENQLKEVPMTGAPASVVASETEPMVEAVAEVEVVAAPDAVIDAPADADPAEDTEAELIALRQFKAAVEAEAAQREQLTKRRTSLSEAGVMLSDEEYTSKAELITSLDDSAFAQFVDSLVLVQRAAKTVSVASASANLNADVHTDAIPDPVTSNRVGDITISQMAAALRELRNKK